MQTQAIEVIETEVVLEEAMSLNHSRLISRLTWQLSAAYEQQYDILAELEFELNTGNFKPDVAIISKWAYNWQEDLIRFPHPPITAIEVLSPTQAFDAVASKIVKYYLPAGVRSAWLIVPFIKTVYIFSADGAITAFAPGSTLQDPASGIELTINNLFQ
ncbi:Uma2 family endonuclease [Hymenobacter baengnokdamensis]|uniref:Uma2 family endonuclease n=1 Tax=Hymenobacter baengnokdamensis TaxID=2615203 RepID=UPI001245CDBF|nr:Uma2 family endonuclease [Hymenobacter baengnokdamensis]